MYFIAIGSLERAKRMSQYKMSRLMIIVIQREGKRRKVAHIEAISCC